MRPNDEPNQMLRKEQNPIHSAMQFSGDFHQSQSQFSEFDDNMSQVIMNYENLTGLIQ